jgi:hypothetical protein
MFVKIKFMKKNHSELSYFQIIIVLFLFFTLTPEMLMSQVWLPNKATQGTCKGDCMNGEGIMRFNQGDKYKGDWKNGMPNGEGTYFWKRDGKYIGEWKDGLPHGKGIAYEKGKDKKEAIFTSNIPDYTIQGIIDMDIMSLKEWENYMSSFNGAKRSVDKGMIYYSFRFNCFPNNTDAKMTIGKQSNGENRLLQIEFFTDLNDHEDSFFNFDQHIMSPLTQFYVKSEEESERYNFKQNDVTYSFLINKTMGWWKFMFINSYGSPMKDYNFLVDGTDIREVDTYSIESMIDIFLKDSKAQGININKDQEIKATFEIIDGITLGLAYEMNNDKKIRLVIDPKLWSAASLQKKWYILYHELGHDVLNLEHGQGGKMMFNFADREYTWNEFLDDKMTMFQYVKE